MSESEPYIVCSVLNWNNYEDTRQCIESLLEVTYSNLEVLLVDNGSTDGSGRKVADEFEEISSIMLGDNLGFGGGHNRGIRCAMERGAAYTMLLNNDVTLPDDRIFQRLVDTMEEHDDIGVLTPQVYRSGDTEECHFRRGVIDYTTAKPDYEYPDHAGDSELIANDYVPFIATLIRPVVFETVGLYPEEYFLYYGDLDYCTQIREAGYEIKTDPSCRVYHGGSNTSGESVAPIRSYYNTRNRFTWARKFPDRIDATSFYSSVLTDLCYQSVRRIYYGESAGLIALLRGAVDGLTGKTGKGPYP